MTIPPRPVGLLHLGPTRTPGQSELSIQVDHVRALNLKLCDIKERLRRAAVARDIALRDGMVWQEVGWPDRSPLKNHLASALVTEDRLVSDIDYLLNLLHLDD